MSKNAKKWPSAILNNLTFIHWYDILKSLAINRFEWVNLPETVDYRFLELQLFEKGYCLFFKDEFVDLFLTLPCTISGKWNVYNIPIERVAYATNNYRYYANDTDSVIIWNDYLHHPLVQQTRLYALKLYELERAIDTNVKTQKYPAIIKSSESQRLVMQNLMMQYDGNVPFIFGDNNLDLTGLEVINLNAPYVADKLRQLKQNYINEYLTIIGVENSNNEKKERMISDEVGSNYGSIEAFRNLGLKSRKQACEEINALYGLQVDVRYSSDLPTMVNTAMRPDLQTRQQTPPPSEDIEEREAENE